MIANPALTIEREHRPPILREQVGLDPFETLLGDMPSPQHDLLEGSPSRLRTPRSSAAPEIPSLHLYTIPEDAIAANWVRIR